MKGNRILLSINYNTKSNQSITINRASSPAFRRYDDYNYSSSSKTRKRAVGFASLLVPGLGQVINGETYKGIAFFLASICNYVLFLRNNDNRMLGLIGMVGIRTWSAHDANKNA